MSGKPSEKKNNKMTCKFKTSKEYKEKKKRIQNIPKISQFAIAGLRKRDCVEFIKIFHDGIKQDLFGLRRLEKITVASKKRMSYSQPTTPLYGKGDDAKPKSFSNMLRMKKMKNAWKVFPSWGKHHKANLQLKVLLKIHEMGCTIKRGTSFIRIPPRPAFMLAKEKFLRKVSTRNDSKMFKRKITEYINKGRDEWFSEMTKIFYSKYQDLVE